MKKGFTLVEMIAVVTLIALISIITLPTIINQVNKSKTKLDNSFESLLNEAALKYIDNDGTLAANRGSVNCIQIKTLQEYGYIEDPLLKPSSKEEIDKNLYIKINSTSNIDHYFELTDTCVPVAGFDEPPLLQEVIKGAENVDEFSNYYSVSDYRYVGKNVNNYVTFNDEKWRIIGVVNEYVKLVRDESIGSFTWTNQGNNNIANSDTYQYLNSTYYDSLVPKAKDMIEERQINVGGVNLQNETLDRVYQMENGTSVVAGSPTKLNGSKLALMYVSDYGYSLADSCQTNKVSEYTGMACQVNGTWIFKDTGEWYLSPYSGDNACATTMSNASFHILCTLTDSRIIRPTTFLKNDVRVSSGDGSYEHPYKIYR